MTPTTDTRPLSRTATNMLANTRGTTKRSIGEMPSTSMASISSRILRLPRSAQMAEPPAPEMSSAHTIGAASRTMASTAAEPVNDWAPTWRDRLPICNAMTAPNGIETSAVGRIVTLAMNQACSIISRHWNRRWRMERKNCTNVSRHIAKKLPPPRNGAVALAELTYPRLRLPLVELLREEVVFFAVLDLRDELELEVELLLLAVFLAV